MSNDHASGPTGADESGLRPSSPAPQPQAVDRPPPSPAPPQGPDADAAASPGDASETETGPPPTPITQQIGRGVVVVLAVLFGVFAVANSQRVSFSWIFGETQVITDATGAIISGGIPLIVLLVASLLIGVLVGITVMWQRARTRRRRAREGGDSATR